MSKITLREIAGKDGQPVNFLTGFTIGAAAAGPINNIGIPGQQGFGLGICPGPLPAGMSEMDGTRNITSDNYGNYMYSDGSVMVWMPAYFYKYGTGANGVALNSVDIKPRSAYESVALANASGYALHRAFYDGFEQPGVFEDKYLGTKNGSIFSSLKNSIPCDTDNSQTGYGINQLAGTPALNLGGMQAACKTRGSNFHGTSIFIYKALALLSYAHAVASTNSTYCAWYSASGTNYPKGCNNNALGDANDASLSFVSAGHPTYSVKPKTGSANLFARTTHNGQNNGIADLNGAMWEVAFGLTSDGAEYYALKTSKRLRDLTGGTGGATDLFGAPGITANYDSIGATYGSLTASSSAKTFGAATQVFDAATSGTAWQATGAGIPIATGGTNAFGNDGLWDYRPAELCPIVGAHWDGGAAAGVWALSLANVRAVAHSTIGGRAALYL